MLTNGFTKNELSVCTPGATIECVESVVMQDSRKIAFTAGKAYKVLSATDWLLTLENNEGRRHHMYGDFFRHHFASRHLSATAKN